MFLNQAMVGSSPCYGGTVGCQPSSAMARSINGWRWVGSAAGVAAIHQPDQPLHQIVHIAERAGLAAIAIQRERLSAQRLHDEVAHHAAVIGQHPRPVGVEDPRHADLGAVHAPVVEAQRFGNALALVVAAADADGENAAAVALGLECLGSHSNKINL